MKTFITQKQNWKKIVLAALATAIIAPLATPSAQAAPKDSAPAYGYRNKDDKGKGNKNKKAKKNKNKDMRDDDRDEDRDDDDDRDRNEDRDRNGINDRDESDYRNGRSVTLTGTFVRDLPGNRFEMRASNGATYQVMTRSNTPVRLMRGDQVTVSGRVVGNDRFIIADRVRTSDRADRGDFNQNIGRVNFTATVTSVRSDRELQVRSVGGRIYTVRTEDRFSSSIDEGDRVRVTGRMRSNVIEEGRVQLLNNNDRDDDNDNRTINFEGRVQSSGSSFGDSIITVRADNGTTYRVRLNSNTRFDNGDRVRVSGRLRNGVVDATRVVLIDGDNDDNDGTGNIDFRGRVESSRSFLGQRILTVRADNGTTYRVRFNGNVRFDNGQRVRVRGDLRNGIVFANDIDRI